MKKILLIIVFLLPIVVLSQDDEKKFGIKFSGFVKTDIYFDSRQTVDAREGQFLLYPKNEQLDENGEDINAATKFTMLSIQTRLKGTITGPDVLGAKTSGVIEGAFFGNIGTDINGFRLRHAFVKLTWKKSELLIGQYWHPMFVTACFPGTVSFNTGTPFQPFARNPQVRFTKRFGKFNAIGTITEQVDFTDFGPIAASPKYLINSTVPEANLRFEFNNDKVLAGVGINYKTLMPRLMIRNSYELEDVPVNVDYKTNERVAGTSFFGYFKVKTDPITIKLYGVGGQMMFSMTNLGGYAETEVQTADYQLSPDSITPKTTYINYSPLGTASVWMDIHTNGVKWQFGLFGGYSKNLGCTDEIEGAVYARGSDIAYAYRIAPRVIFNAGKFRIAPELEYTVAAYGTPDEKGIVQDAIDVGNFRVLLGVYYFF